MSTYQIRAGDTITMDPSTLTNRAAATIDLTGATVTFVADDWLGTNVINAAATIAHNTGPATLYLFRTSARAR